MIELIFAIVVALILVELLPVILMVVGLFGLWLFVVVLELFQGRKL